MSATSVAKASRLRGIGALFLVVMSTWGCAKSEQSAKPEQAEAYRQKHIQRTERMQQDMSKKR